MAFRKKKKVDKTIDIVNIKSERAKKEKREQAFIEKASIERAKSVFRREKTRKIFRKSVIILIALVITVAVSTTVINIITLSKEKKQLESDQKQLEQEYKELETEIKNADDPEYVEKTVREKLNMVYPDEIIYQTKEDSK